MNEKEAMGRALKWFGCATVAADFWGVNEMDVHIKLAKHIIH